MRQFNNHFENYLSPSFPTIIRILEVIEIKDYVNRSFILVK